MWLLDLKWCLQDLSSQTFWDRFPWALLTSERKQSCRWGACQQKNVLILNGKSHKFGWLGGKNKNRLPYQNMSVLKEGMKKSPLSYSLRVVFPGCGQSQGSVSFWHTSQITLHPPPAVNSFVPFRFNFVTLILFCPLCHPNAPSPLPLPVSSFAKPAHNSSPPPPRRNSD